MRFHRVALIVVCLRQRRSAVLQPARGARCRDRRAALCLAVATLEGVRHD